MAVKRKMTVKHISMPAGVGVGIVMSIIVTLIGTGVLSFMISKESVGDSGVGVGCFLILLCGALSGALLASMLIKRQRLIVCMVEALCYYLVLLCMTALLFGGQYSGLGSAALAVLAGGALAVAPELMKGKNKSKKWKSFR